MRNKKLLSQPAVIGMLVIALISCCGFGVVTLSSAVFLIADQPTIVMATALPPIFESAPHTLTPTIALTRTPFAEVNLDTDTLEVLQNTIVPENDPYELACRLKNICDVSKTVPGKAYQLGDRERFWVLNADTDQHYQIEATLLYITPHTYFWAEEGVQVNQADLSELMETFESKIYPTNREFFGSEWTPGVDDDPHIFVLYVGKVGRNVAGYFYSSDALNPIINPYSNAHEMYVFGRSRKLSSNATFITLAHEFVHMIQFAADRNDVTWLNEGFAEVGAFINGYYTGTGGWRYAQNPDLQLTDWADSLSPDFGSHYGQSFLFLTYFLDRFGREATQALTKNPENDLASVDDTLAQLNITDPRTGQIITADAVFMDWAAALYLMDGSVGDGRYTYHNFSSAPQTQATDVIDTCPSDPLTRTVNQYGIDYIRITCSGDHTIQFTGSAQVPLLPAAPHSGDYAFWSNRGNESDMTLTRAFDFSNVTGPIELSYWTWFDIEQDYDYLYLEASSDNGKTWTILKTPSGTDTNLNGQNYGWAYTGQTGRWQPEKVDLSPYAGQTVLIRFEYVTDGAANGAGFLLDDVAVDATHYQTDFETADDGWQAAGFARVQNVLPQTFHLARIIKGDTTTVDSFPAYSNQTTNIALTLQPGEEAVLIVTGTTRFTYTAARYSLSVK